MIYIRNIIASLIVAFAAALPPASVQQFNTSPSSNTAESERAVAVFAYKTGNILTSTTDLKFPDRSKQSAQATAEKAKRDADAAEAARNAEAAKLVNDTHSSPNVPILPPDTSLAAKMLQLRLCESGNNYANKNNPLYRGAYQYDFATWSNYGGYYDPADAPPEVQDAKFLETYARRGGSPWPVCGRKAGL